MWRITWRLWSHYIDTVEINLMIKLNQIQFEITSTTNFQSMALYSISKRLCWNKRKWTFDKINGINSTTLSTHKTRYDKSRLLTVGVLYSTVRVHTLGTLISVKKIDQKIMNQPFNFNKMKCLPCSLFMFRIKIYAIICEMINGFEIYIRTLRVHCVGFVKSNNPTIESHHLDTNGKMWNVRFNISTEITVGRFESVCGTFFDGQLIIATAY